MRQILILEDLPCSGVPGQVPRQGNLSTTIAPAGVKQAGDSRPISADLYTDGLLSITQQGSEWIAHAVYTSAEEPLLLKPEAGTHTHV